MANKENLQASLVSELIQALNKDNNSPENRRTALSLIVNGQVGETDLSDVVGGIEKGWRGQGEVDSSELDTANLK